MDSKKLEGKNPVLETLSANQGFHEDPKFFFTSQKWNDTKDSGLEKVNSSRI